MAFRFPKIPKLPKIKWEMPFVYLTLYLAIFLGPGLLAANSACYSQLEFEADRGLRLHTDMEVIMLTCKYSTQGQSLKIPYTTFVKRYSPTIGTWQNTIARAYSGSGRGRDEVIDNFRTALANNKSREAAMMGPKNFCTKWADFVPFAANLTPPQMYAYLRANDAARPTKRSLCGN